MPVNSRQVVNSEDVFWKCSLGYPHTSHCLGSGEIMISTLGDPSGSGKGTPVPPVSQGEGARTGGTVPTSRAVLEASPRSLSPFSSLVCSGSICLLLLVL